MALMVQKFKNLYRELVILTFVLESYYQDPLDGGSVWCTMEWDLVHDDTKFLDATISAMRLGYFGDGVGYVNFTPGEPLKKNAPFEVTMVLLFIDGSVVFQVYGQESLRIRGKWQTAFSQLVKREVILEWPRPQGREQ